MKETENHHTWAGHLDMAGRLLIPKEARITIGCQPGTDVVIESDGDSLRVLTLEQFTKEVQGAFGAWKEGQLLPSEQLIDERRNEAKRERHS